ncbi:hypothetical protein [Laspinema olomoucense]|uniref:Phage abortive infection protein n=1 Tax=Laspinema olomoucense D3b TaxID=2953688 RepID=A0ABT2NBV9_9CYAN|nr:MULTISPECIES: hypothetical protein [unclassified Laspinema]MCT7971495.1 hypothetical protein [Laspinema sp. D3d]MCT7980172.1 hypothetical protein [Laspinema sp. D3b]MCT7987365.1 hypothetical protein [Laspinema sp. D3a]MCT7992072.1 hypothetical protein [Laspinema sp. D3c]
MLNPVKKLLLPSGLNKSYILLFFILFLSIFSSYSCINGLGIDPEICRVWLKELSINLIAEVTGILLVLFSVNKAVRESREKEKNKFKEIAFRQLKFTIRKQIYLFFEILKASTPQKPDKTYKRLEDLFDDTYFKEVQNLDLLTRAPVLTPAGEPMDWLDYLVYESLNLRSALGRVVDRYAFYLESEVVDLMEEMTDASFIRFLTSLWEAKRLDGLTSKGDLLFACEDMFREYADSLVKLVKFYNENVTRDRQIIIDEQQWQEWWNHKGRPQLGDSRIKIEIQ